MNVRWRTQILFLTLVCMNLISCTVTIDPIRSVGDVITSALERCNITLDETFMVDLIAWNEGALQAQAPCDQMRSSLTSWRDEHGDDWEFLDNPASDGPMPSFYNLRAFGLWLEDVSGVRRIVVNADESQIGYSDEKDAYKWSDLNGALVGFEPDRLKELVNLVGGAVVGSEWVPVPGWSNALPASYTGPGWVPVGGMWWRIVICASDYSLYRFNGDGAGPENLKDFVDTMWGFTL